jgi:chemotaxis protein MotB
MSKKHKGEEHSGGESGSGRWMLTYLDMITLLFGVFIILYAMSSVDKSKFEKVAESLRIGFQGGRTIFPGKLTGGQTIFDDLQPLGSKKRSLRENIDKVIKPEVQRNIMRVTETERGVQITLFGDVFFESGSSDLKKETTEQLMKIAPILSDVRSYIVVEGYTDDQPVKSQVDRDFSNNWELAAFRAINIIRFFEAAGIPSDKMSAKSYGMYQPLDAGVIFQGKITPEYRAMNRRVSIVIETGTPYRKKEKSPSPDSHNDKD